MTGQFDKARDEYMKWLALAPNDRAALNNLAYLLAEDLKKPEQARQYSRQAFEEDRRNGVRDPGVADTHAWVLTLCGGSDAVQGLNLLYSIVQDNPSFLEARYHLGMAYLRSNDAKRAEQQLATAMTQVEQLEQGHGNVDGKLKGEIAQALKQAREQNGDKARADAN
jgi:Tfp pilus assembly protein PilF